MKILITGVSGFIGGRLAEHLEARGHAVIGTGRGAKNHAAALYAYVPADLTQAAECERVLVGVDAVVHCAGKAGAWGAYAEYARANVLSTQRLLAACQKSGVRRLINLSSPSIYFDYRHQFDLNESDRPRRFSNAYAATKFAAEQAVSAAHSSTLATLSLRPRGVIGAGDASWLPRIIAMREGNALIQPGDGSNLAEFTAVENLLDAIELSLLAPSEKLGGVYNITNGTPERLWDVIESALGAVGLDGHRRRVPLPVAMALARLLETYHRLRRSSVEPEVLPVKVGVAAFSMTMSIAKAQRDLGYVPRVSTAAAVDAFARWWRHRLRD